MAHADGLADGHDGPRLAASRTGDATGGVVGRAAGEPAGEPAVDDAGGPGPTLWLVRHGESTWNELGLVQGHRDGPRLTPRGVVQAEQVARRLAARPVRAVYSSDLLRAVETARPVAAAHRVEPVADARLRERCFGSDEGTPSAELGPERSGLDGGRVVDADAASPGGESVRQLCRRVAGFLDELAADQRSRPETAGDVVLVVHGGVVRAALAHLDGTGPDGMGWGPVDNAQAVSRPLAPARRRPAAGPPPIPSPARHPVRKGATMHETALRLPQRAGKPRRTGVTMVVDGGLPLGTLRDLVASAGEHLDYVKFGWGTALVSGEIHDKAALLREAGIDYYLGGTLFEKHVLQGQFEAFRDLCRRLGCRHVEVSNGTIDLSNTEKAGYVRKLGGEFTVISEVGYKDGTRSEKLMPRRWIEYINEDLDAGAALVTLESRESGSSGICRPDGRLRIGLIEELLGDGVPADRLMFEAPTTTLQTYFVKRVGTDVNLGNVPATGVIGLETLRLGLRADTLTDFEPSRGDGHEDGDR